MNTITNEVFKTAIEKTVFGKAKNTFKNYWIFIVPVIMCITRRCNQTIDTMSFGKRLFGGTASTTTITVIRDRTVTTRTNKGGRIITVTSQTTNTGRSTVAVVTTIFGYFYTPPFREL